MTKNIPFDGRRIFSRSGLSACLLLVLTLSLQAGPTPYPEKESDWPGKGPVRVFDWMKVNRDFFWSSRDKAEGAVVFVGDSLIGNWKGMGGSFAGKKTANRGIGGDVSRGLLFRFQEDVLELKPRAVVILIGTNDLSAKARIPDIISNLEEVLALAGKHDPALPLILCTIPPRDSGKAPIDPSEVTACNAALAELAAKNKQVRLFDSYKLFVQADGKPDPRYFQEDLLHLGPAGYELFAEKLNKEIP